MRKNRTSRTRWQALGVVGMSLAIGLAGCGTKAAHSQSSAVTTAPPGVVLSAYTHTATAGSARVSLSETVTSSTSTEKVSIKGSGLLDFSGKNGELVFSVPSLGNITTRFVGEDLYFQFPPKVQATTPGHKPWVSIDLSQVVKAKLGASVAQLTSSSQTSTQTLSYLQSVSDRSVRRVGTASLAGVATTEYAATVDLTKAAANKSPAVRAAIAKLEGQLHRSTFPLTVWIDGHRQVRQIAYAITVPSTNGATVTVALTMGYSDFGVPVHVTAPPLDQVDNITSQAVHAATSTATSLPAPTSTGSPEAAKLVLGLADLPAGWSVDTATGPTPQTCQVLDSFFSSQTSLTRSQDQIAYHVTATGIPALIERVLVYRDGTAAALSGYSKATAQLSGCRTYSATVQGHRISGTVKPTHLDSYGDRSSAFLQASTSAGPRTHEFVVIVQKGRDLLILGYGDVNPRIVTVQQLMSRAVAKLR